MNRPVTASSSKALASGTLLAIGALQWFFCVMIAEGLHSGFMLPTNQWIPYSNQIHYVSELGVGSTALLFNASTIVLGLTITCASVLLYLEDRAKLFSGCLILAGLGAMGVGVFSTEIQPTHGVFQLLALVFGALAAILSYRRTLAPLSHVSLLLGVVSIGSSIAFFSYLGLGINDMSTFIGLRKGIMERLAIYPVILWVIGYGYQHVHSSAAEKPRGSNSSQGSS